VPTHRPFSQRATFASVLGLVLLLKALVPAGWMPVFDDGGVALRLCGDWAPAPRVERAVDPHHHMAEHGAAAPAPADHDQHDDAPSGSDQPCSFAAAAFAWTSADGPTAPGALPPSSTAASAFSRSVAVGRGLAAPPPPSTGPPLLS
jgi:hypothetical protein